MTKALVCLHPTCDSVHTFRDDSSLTVCDCGRCMGWWTDPNTGFCAVFADEADRQYLSVLSLHNGFMHDSQTAIPKSYYDAHTQHLLPVPQAQVDESWRQLHLGATIAPAGPDTSRVWDRARRGCWAAFVEPGSQADVQWAVEADARAKRDAS